MKRRAFPGHGPETEARYQRAGKWLLATIYRDVRAAYWCMVNGVAIVKAAGGGIGTTGGFLVPTELSNAILDLRETYGAFRRRARIIPMASDTTTIARHTDAGKPTVFFVGENTTTTESTVSLDSINLTAKKIGALVRISSELEEDAETDIVDFIANEIALAFAAQEDDCAFNGDGTSAYGKMRGIGTIALDGNHNKAKVTASVATFLTLTSTDLAKLISGVQAAAIPNAAWFCSQTCFAETFIRLAGAAGQDIPMFLVDGIMTPHYLGFPVILTQKLPLIETTLTGKVMLAFGDMYQGAVLGQRRGITIARSADRYMDQNQIAVLATERFHAVVHDMGDNAGPGALAALVAP